MYAVMTDYFPSDVYSSMSMVPGANFYQMDDVISYLVSIISRVKVNIHICEYSPGKSVIQGSVLNSIIVNTII